MAAESEKWHTLQHLCSFRGRKKVVIPSFPDFKGKVQLTAIKSVRLTTLKTV